MGEEYSSHNGWRQELEEDEQEWNQESEKALVVWSKDGMGYVLTQRCADEMESLVEIRE